MAVTKYDVAKYSGVSPSTVTNVLHGRVKKVSPEVRKRVIESIKKLGYVPDEAARRLRLSGAAGGRKALDKSCIGFVISESVDGGMSNGFFSRMLNGILHECNQRGIRLLVDYVKENRGDPPVLPAIVQSWSIDAMIISSVLDARFAGYILGTKMPVVQIGSGDYNGRRIDRIEGETVKGARMAVKYLVDRGHREIAMFNGKTGSGSCSLKQEGYESVLKEAGIVSDRNLVINSELGYAPGYEAMEEMIRRGRKFTAVFAADDDTALGAKAAAEKHGLSIPGDISLVGFNNVPLAAEVKPALTTINSRNEEMGRMAVNRVADLLLNGEQPPMEMKFPMSLIERDSVKRIRTH